MIKLSRINGIPFYLNAELIEQIESSPDTVITLHTGKTVMVANSIQQVIHKVICYKRRIHTQHIRRKSASGCVT
ncbi:MAG: flagellar protein FlbD [Candidatus Riflebacteria bacterium HGW-Riflebacteria-1]|jgi:flagellar protein FlbD|nr:MAG: flagellar protein FlbD [Candidatus Riflebacteria bacterium HGW-Riflebacteria-1]